MPVLTPAMRVITQPGAYVAQQDIAHFDGNYGLQIDCPNVTINFNGHYFGNNGPAAIYAGSDAYNVTIEGGHIWGGSNYGIRMEGYVEENRVTSNEVYGQKVVGISVEGYGYTQIDNNTVHDVHAADRAYGIEVEGNGVITAYNDVFALTGGNEAVHYSDTGVDHQVYGNTFSDAASGQDPFLAWVDADGDQFSFNTFVGGNESNTEGITYNGFDPLVTMDNDVINITPPDFYYFGHIIPDPHLNHDIFL